MGCRRPDRDRLDKRPPAGGVQVRGHAGCQPVLGGHDMVDGTDLPLYRLPGRTGKISPLKPRHLHISSLARAVVAALVALMALDVRGHGRMLPRGSESVAGGGEPVDVGGYGRIHRVREPIVGTGEPGERFGSR